MSGRFEFTRQEALSISWLGVNFSNFCCAYSVLREISVKKHVSECLIVYLVSGPFIHADECGYKSTMSIEIAYQEAVMPVENAQMKVHH